jgi:hypothetical protein
MDHIISFFVDLMGSNGILRQSLALLWIVAGLVTLAAPAAIQRDRIVRRRRILYVSFPLLVIATLGLTFLPALSGSPVENPAQLAAQLAMCKISNDAENVRYRASVHWRRPPTSGIATFHIGALNRNYELWTQVTSGRIVQGQDAQVDFTVSRGSMFPTYFAVYGLDRSAEETRANACRSGKCYLQLPRAGVFRLSEEFTVNNFHQSVPRC